MKNWNLLLKVGLVVLVSSLGSDAWGQLYWRTDGTSGTWVTGTNWGATPLPTGGTAWSSGSNAIFSANSTVTFATTVVGNVTVADGITVTVSQAGTASGISVRTYNIGTGSTLNWVGQDLSTSSGFGVIKNGAGVWDMGVQGNPFNATNGGFTLNAGTVVVGGNNCFGGSPSILTLNGGTIQSSGTRIYANNITVGGNFILSGTGNATHSGTVALGASTRTITNSTTSGSRIFSGVISGTAGIIFDGASAGIFTLSGANTFSGTFTGNGGTTNLNLNSALGSVTSVTVGSGATVQTGVTTLTNAINDAASVTIEGTGEMDLTGGSETVASLTSASTTSSLVIGDNGGTAGSFTVGDGNSTTFAGVISGNRATAGSIFTKTGAGTLTLTGTNTYTTTLSTGLTTVSAGTLELNRAGGTTIPTTSNFAVNGGTLLISTNQTLNNLTVASGATVSVPTGVTLTITGTMTVSGTINCGATAVVDGTGAFTLSSDATFITANASGITGSITVSGTKNFSSGANYEFQGASTGTFTTTPTGNTVNNLTINRSGGDVSLGQNLTVASTLTLTAGRLNLSSFTLSFSNTIAGIPAWGNNSAKYIIASSGSLSTNNPATTLFPIGTSGQYLPCRLSGTGVYSVNLSNTSAGLTQPSLALPTQWNISGSGTLDMDYQWPTDVFGTTTYLFKYDNNTMTWSTVGGPVTASGIGPLTAGFTGISCCSGFTVGAENALPVELVAFKGVLANKKVNLTWQTASELNNSHFSIEKSTNGTTFREIGTVQGKGTSYELNDYSFTDESPARGLNYYRLKQLDFDGNFEYSKVVSVNFGGGKGQVQLFPTVASYEIQVRFPAPTEEAGTIQVFDQSGKLVKRVSFEAELTDLPISVEEFQSGVYFVKVQNGQLFETLRFVRQ